MVIAFANNQVIVAASGTTSSIYTDPVPMNDNDRATCHFFAEYVFNPNGTGVQYVAQVSNDGVNWVNVPGLTDSATAATTTPQAKIGTVNGAFLRFQLNFGATGGIGACSFDLHVLLDHV